MSDVRWIQRFSNFDRAYTVLARHINNPELNEIEMAGIIQFFEMAFELAWKVMKDYLENQGYDVKGPRDAIKLSFKIGMIQDGELWLKALEERNLSVHTYDEVLAKNMINNIKIHYFPMLSKMYETFQNEIGK